LRTLNQHDFEYLLAKLTTVGIAGRIVIQVRYVTKGKALGGH